MLHGLFFLSPPAKFYNFFAFKLSDVNDMQNGRADYLGYADFLGYAKYLGKHVWSSYCTLKNPSFHTKIGAFVRSGRGRKLSSYIVYVSLRYIRNTSFCT